MAWNPLVSLDYPVLRHHCYNFRPEHGDGMAEASQTQPLADFERQRLGVERQSSRQRKIWRHPDEHCEVSYCKDERSVHDEGSVVEETFEMVVCHHLPLRGGLFHLAEG